MKNQQTLIFRNLGDGDFKVMYSGSCEDMPDSQIVYLEVGMEYEAKFDYELPITVPPTSEKRSNRQETLTHFLRVIIGVFIGISTSVGCITWLTKFS